jgi:hypothetical protein
MPTISALSNTNGGGKATIQCGFRENVSGNVNVTFEKPFDGVPAVVASGDLGDCRIRNLTNAGFQMSPGNAGMSVFYWIAVYQE